MVDFSDKEVLAEVSVSLVMSRVGVGEGFGVVVVSGEGSGLDGGSTEALGGGDSSVGEGVGDVEDSGKDSSVVEPIIALSVAPCAKTGGIKKANW